MRPAAPPAPPPKRTVRCAVYTRKSTNEGLEQDFNSLDAQRDSAESYVASQKSEGWVCLPTRYDDGGYSGGTLDRPAFQRLLADVEAGQVDCVLIYKVDRFSRSLLDFARVMSKLEERGVALVSVTQQFNTTSSMGRLTLNILLSFAQFEREIISERTRDKIAAARRKGKWHSGMPVLGYDVDPKTRYLLVNEPEAARVRELFELYLKERTLLPVVKELSRRGWRNKACVTGKGRQRGGRLFDKTSLFKLLTNVTYLGKMRYKTEVLPGQHPAIVNADVFNQVQELLRRNGRNCGNELRNSTGALLKGLLRCKSCDCAMIHSHTVQKRRRYRYYVCSRAQKMGWHVCPTKSVPAAEIERFVVGRVRAIGKDDALIAATIERVRRQSQQALEKLEHERQQLQQELQRMDTETRKLAAMPQDDVTAGMLASLHERTRLAEQRATQVREQILGISKQVVDEREVVTALSMFDPVWDSLTSREQARIIQMLVERVVYDGANGTVAVTFRPTGLKMFADEVNGAKKDKR